MYLGNALAHYYDDVQRALDVLISASEAGGSKEFEPGAKLPALTPQMSDFLSPSAIAHSRMGRYGAHELSLLNLTLNPATRTTKTFASLVIVARAIRYIQDTGQRITIVTPSSANKAVALRDAVLRAIRAKLVDADQLNVISLVPKRSAYKLHSSELFTEPYLRARNPIGVHEGRVSDAVKTIARNVVDRDRSLIEGTAKTNLWYTLQLENYLAADVVRAVAENDFFPPAPGVRRAHAHAVSSAYGLLGHAYGRQTLGERATGLPSRYLLVQHLGAPDMVTHLLGGVAAVPRYAFNSRSGRYEQHESPHFPALTYDPDEVLDPTFYTRKPATADRMTALIRAQGGTGIVVSLAECLERYGQVRALLADADVAVPANPTWVKEWSLIMVMTGVLNAIDRGLVDDDDIVIHGSGVYSVDGFDGLTARELHEVGDEDDFRELMLQALA